MSQRPPVPPNVESCRNKSGTMNDRRGKLAAAHRGGTCQRIQANPVGTVMQLVRAESKADGLLRSRPPLRPRNFPCVSLRRFKPLVT
jgi:hypothetical protein